MCVADSKKGMIMEVDLEYPSHLHKLHNYYPLAAERIRVNKDMLSPYCETSMESVLGKYLNFLKSLGKKEKYVLHYRNLQLYLSLGLKLKKVHLVLEFDQSPWLKQYIDFNTQK